MSGPFFQLPSPQATLVPPFVRGVAQSPPISLSRRSAVAPTPLSPHGGVLLAGWELQLTHSQRGGASIETFSLFLAAVQIRDCDVWVRRGDVGRACLCSPLTNRGAHGRRPSCCGLLADECGDCERQARVSCLTSPQCCPSGGWHHNRSGRLGRARSSGTLSFTTLMPTGGFAAMQRCGQSAQSAKPSPKCSKQNTPRRTRSTFEARAKGGPLTTRRCPPPTSQRHCVTPEAFQGLNPNPGVLLPPANPHPNCVLHS